MSIVIPPPPGACPSCEGSGDVGQPCPERVCQRQGVHFVPHEYARASWNSTSLDRESLAGQFVGDFLVLGRVGKGGFGRVLLALQRPLFRLRGAVKLLELGGADATISKRVIDKFENEAAVLAVLNHPNIVRLLHYGTHQNRPYLAMEFVPGSQTLQTVMNRLIVEGNTLEPTVLKHVLNQVLDGLEAAHQQNIIHRDIKPENIMLHEVVGNPHHVKLLDFGIAKVIEHRSETSVVMGTVQYMAPEQIEAKNLGPWTDLYSTGCIAFEFMTGHRAFPGDDPQAILSQKLSPDYDPFAHVGPNRLPPAAIAFLRKSLDRDPAKRYRSTAEFRTAMNAVYLTLATTEVFAQHLSHIVDSQELGRLRAEQQLLEKARLAIDSERREIDTARRDLESERKKLASERLGIPAEVESKAYGNTMAFPSIAPLTPLPPAARPSTILQTGRADFKNDTQVGEQTHPRRWRWAWGALLVLLLCGGAILIVQLTGTGGPTSGGSGSASTTTSTPPTISAADRLAAGALLEEAGDRTADASVDTAPATPPAPLVADATMNEETDSAASQDSGPAPIGPQVLTLLLESHPPATVLVDKQARGTTPFTLTWNPAEASPKVRLQAAGYRPQDVRITPEDVESGSRLVTLERLPRAPSPEVKRPGW